MLDFLTNPVFMTFAGLALPAFIAFATARKTSVAQWQLRSRELDMADAKVKADDKENRASERRDLEKSLDSRVDKFIDHLENSLARMSRLYDEGIKELAEARGALRACLDHHEHRDKHDARVLQELEGLRNRQTTIALATPPPAVILVPGESMPGPRGEQGKQGEIGPQGEPGKDA